MTILENELHFFIKKIEPDFSLSSTPIFNLRIHTKRNFISHYFIMSIKNHYLEQTLTAFWDVVSDENWFLSSDDDDVDDGALLRAMRDKLHNIQDHPTCDDTMSIKKHYLEQILSLFWDVVSDENWFLCSDDGDVDDGVLLRLMREKLPNIEDHP